MKDEQKIKGHLLKELKELRRQISLLKESEAKLKRVQETLRQSEDRYRSLFDNSPISLWEEDWSDVKAFIDCLKDAGVRDFRTYFNKHPEDVVNCVRMVKVIDINNATLVLYKARNKKELQEGIGRVIPEETHEAFIEELICIAEGEIIFKSEQIDQTLKGEKIDIMLRWSVSPGCEETYSRVLLSIVDITEFKQAQMVLLEASRLEVTETLAGGIAHDFNNLMTEVLGCVELLKLDLAGQTEIISTLNDIYESAQQAGRLTQQLLSFSRSNKYQPKLLNLNGIIRETLILHKRFFPSRIQIRSNLESKLKSVMFDPMQMSQVVINLCINAVESIEKQGLIIITTQNLYINNRIEKNNFNLAPGRYIYFSIEDNGCGMNAETLSKAFEPFFTTKFQGRGLGLSAVYGIVKSHHGHILIESEENKGTKASIYLPAIQS